MKNAAVFQNCEQEQKSRSTDDREHTMTVQWWIGVLVSVTYQARTIGGVTVTNSITDNGNRAQVVTVPAGVEALDVGG